MKFEEVEKIIRGLKVGDERIFYKCSDGSKIYVIRPEKPGRVKRKYKKEINLQIYLHKPGHKPFRPNHLRVLLNLHLKKESKPQLTKKILKAAEKIYEGEDPEKIVKQFKNLDFPMQIDPLDTDLFLIQLFMIEQAITWGVGSGNISKYNPPYLFFMGFIREVLDGAKEIDKILWDVARYHEPLVKYTKLDNKKKKRL